MPPAVARVGFVGVGVRVSTARPSWLVAPRGGAANRHSPAPLKDQKPATPRAPNKPVPQKLAPLKARTTMCPRPPTGGRRRGPMRRMPVAKDLLPTLTFR
ncbi:hypothetical protein GCM10010307_22080 [Streptomyces vastus]|uniref:Uncharacterized protein n=1 Tax=Streptomyces vastus TaxID=285451 RepID=A0ABN3QMV6_9ACTN